MRDPVSPLGHARFDGFATVREIGPLGMITLRGKLDDPAFAAALKKAGFALPQPRRIATGKAGQVAWMSPDEVLVLVDYAQVDAVAMSLSNALASQHHLAINVSDARAVFRVEGARADQVLAKLCPVDFATLAPDEVRRTRAAQVACAFWAADGGFTLVAFRSVAGYVMGLLAQSAAAGSQLRD